MTKLRWLSTAAFALAACAGLTAVAAPAHAESPEDLFVAAIVRQGGLPGAQDNWIQEGHNVCNDLATYAATGVSPAKAGSTEIKVARERGWKPSEALIIIHAAMTHLCPDNSY